MDAPPPEKRITDVPDTPNRGMVQPVAPLSCVDVPRMMEMDPNYSD